MRYGRGMLLTNGNALAGRLTKSAFDLGVPLWLSSPATQLVIEGGAVRGAVVDRNGKSTTSPPARAWCLRAADSRTTSRAANNCFPTRRRATSIFAWADRQYGGRPTTGETVGGKVNTSLPHAAAWVPVSHTTRKDGQAA